VKLGITDGVMSEVTGGKLTEGQQVIVGSENSSSASTQPFGGPGRGGPRF
jgi:hypothetical protein